MIPRLLLFAASWSLLASSAHSNEWRHAWEFCAHKGHTLQAQSAAPGDGESMPRPRKYAPDRIIDVQHLKLEITPDFEARSIEGIATVTFSPIAKAIDGMSLDAVDLRVSEVESTQSLESYYVSGEQIEFLFKEEIPPSDEVTLTIRYSAEPEEGLFFRTPEMGYKEGDTHLWTQGEPQKHRYWFPSYDYPNERFSTEMVCWVPADMMVLSNGKEMPKLEREDGLVGYHWLQEKPHVNYLVSLVAGYFEGLSDSYRDIPLGFYTPPSDFPQAANSFVDTKSILEFFEQEIGVPYPWAKYYNVCVQGYPYGGMENTSVTTLTTRTLFTQEFETLRSTRGLDAHEIAHQWFGDLVTCKDWTHLWLNEGFATYYTELYEGHKFGQDHLIYGMYGNAKQILSKKDDKPIAWRGYDRPWEQFDYRAYPKGSWVLNMLRSQLGPDLYRQCIKTYLEAHSYDVAVTEDLNAAIEDVSGRNFDRFFDQWVYHGGHPELSINYGWDPKRKQARLSVTQTQKVSDRVMLFQFPLPVRFHTKEGVKDFSIDISLQAEDFYFDLPSAPKAVRVDPDYTVLAKVDMKLPSALVEAQATLKDDMMGRLFAVQQLGKKRDAKSLQILADRLAKDEFFGVQVEAAKAIGSRRNEAALEILTKHLKHGDARVRKEVVAALREFYVPAARDSLQSVVADETNPAIVEHALVSLARFPDDTVQEALLTALGRDSYRHTIALGAIQAMRKQDQPVYVDPLLEHMKTNEAAFNDRGLGQAFRHLGYLARDSDAAVKEEVRTYLAGYLNTPREQLIQPAIEALSALNDPTAIALLEPISENEGPDKDLADAARKAIESLNADKTQSRELQDLRKEVLDLQDSIRQLRQQFEQMQKQDGAAR